MQIVTTSPFGDQITARDILQVMQYLHGWEDKYRQLLLWGKQLPAMSDTLKSDQIMVAGCESRVWLLAQRHEGRWFFTADSDARIIRGLIGIIMAACQGKTSSEIISFDIEGYFEQLNLLSHLSPTRGNGIRAIVSQIKSMTQE
ncbi:SufE family protein [Vibrio quintilis]|uniref:Sulfur acceptor protein CsdE n=1 Tax=Vibrio quintilis TaxID=1117707 RepID=A0A1M7Z0V1_9VIBR|nr:SufE family protein [Vibrio quintilis]SHO58460.1 Sulfur acceptor protein CsdE [Vibrio quintilis]